MSLSPPAIGRDDGIYKFTCNTYKLSCVGQTIRNLKDAKNT